MVGTQGFPVVEAGTLGEIVPVNYGPRPEIYGTMKEIQKGYMPQQRKGRFCVFPWLANHGNAGHAGAGFVPGKLFRKEG